MSRRWSTCEAPPSSTFAVAAAQIVSASARDQDVSACDSACSTTNVQIPRPPPSAMMRGRLPQRNMFAISSRMSPSGCGSREPGDARARVRATSTTSSSSAPRNPPIARRAGRRADQVQRVRVVEELARIEDGVAGARHERLADLRNREWRHGALHAEPDRRDELVVAGERRFEGVAPARRAVGAEDVDGLARDDRARAPVVEVGDRAVADGGGVQQPAEHDAGCLRPLAVRRWRRRAPCR